VARRPFLHEQIAALAPLDFVAFVAPRPDGVGFVEVHRLEATDAYRVEVGAEPPLGPDELAAATRLGLRADPEATDEAGNAVFVTEQAGADATAAIADAALAGLFGCPDGAALDVRHGSERLEAEAARRLAALRERLATMLGGMPGPEEVGTDEDGDLTCTIGGHRLVVGPRVVDDGPSLVRVMARTNVDVEPVPGLGLFVAQTNFELEAGRVAFDGPDRTVWFELDLVGDGFTDTDLAFALHFVASGADDLAERIAGLFGGSIADRSDDGEENPAAGADTGGYL